MMEQPTQHITTQCVIAGGGPAGMMLGWLLARAGVDVVVLEKHADFFRDFRGDTIHPSTMELMHELGVLDEFLKRPHQEIRELAVQIGDDITTVADFRHLPTAAKFVALMPQWDFLNFVAEQAKRYPTFRLMLETPVTGLLTEGGRVTGVRVATAQGTQEIRAGLVVGADGRSSTVRALANLPVRTYGSPIDVLWFRLSHAPNDPAQTFGRVDTGSLMVIFDRREYWQCAYVIRKGGFDEMIAQPIQAFRQRVARLVPVARDRVEELKDWNDVKLLTVKVDRLPTWYRPGLLCIGDAAHAMSPVGGIGINLAIQDAVAAANILAGPLMQGPAQTDALRAVQRRREFPTKVTQAGQVFIQDNILSRVLFGTKKITTPLPLRLLGHWKYLRRFPARIVGLGVRPEHVHTPDILAT